MLTSSENLLGHVFYNKIVSDMDIALEATLKNPTSAVQFDTVPKGWAEPGVIASAQVKDSHSFPLPPCSSCL